MPSNARADRRASQPFGSVRAGLSAMIAASADTRSYWVFADPRVYNPLFTSSRLAYALPCFCVSWDELSTRTCRRRATLGFDHRSGWEGLVSVATAGKRTLPGL